MFFSLMGKELKYQFGNLTFYMFLVAVILFYVTQFDPPGSIADLKPKAEAQGERIYYGQKTITEPRDEMVKMVWQLEWDYQAGEISKPLLFMNKSVKLDEQQLAAMEQTLETLLPGGLTSEMAEDDSRMEFAVTYEKYLELVRSLDKKLGGSTAYGDKLRPSILYKEKTYEDAVQDYKDLLEKDRLTNAGGRLFADYMGITAGFFPVFLSAFVLGRDRRTRMQEIIYSRSFSSWRYVLPKYAAVCLILLLGYLAVATHAEFSLTKIAAAEHLDFAYFAFYKYTFAWLLPTIMVTVALGMLVSVLTKYTLVAIPLQFLLWMSTMMPLEGEYGLRKFVIRYNTFGGYDNYVQWSSAIMVNRIFYVLLSLAIMWLVIWIWNRKRGHAGASAKA
ncbi:hypothetical protein [Paenibacillus eucommiae]|uniref:Membrane protein n=1 Tax=Paenibacillus eucommiae TaxID=1355755 RepID=A0ABS4J872_9BACL|nr:hypothetical protein [Paenibacillus eucommiae]MBP1996052.1 putative membrane protein [Paenibacillus eucommiae]